VIEITVNGEKREFESGTTVAVLLDQLGLNTQAIAVEINQQISPREKHC
jgi:thiamine biosynthesis protein ThiS